MEILLARILHIDATLTLSNLHLTKRRIFTRPFIDMKSFVSFITTLPVRARP